MASRSEEARPLLQGDEASVFSLVYRNDSSSTARTLKMLATTLSFTALAVLCASLVLLGVNTPIDRVPVSG